MSTDSLQLVGKKLGEMKLTENLNTDMSPDITVRAILINILTYDTRYVWFWRSKILFWSITDHNDTYKPLILLLVRVSTLSKPAVMTSEAIF